MLGRTTLLPLLLSAAVATNALAQAPGASKPATRSDSIATRPIADAIAHRTGDSIVTIAGRASVSAGKLQSGSFDVAIQDSSGGIRLFSRTLSPVVHEGDSIVATGTIKNYRGNTELVLTMLNVVSAPPRVVRPHEAAVNPVAIARYSGELVSVHGRVAAFGRSEGGQYLRLRDAPPSEHGMLTVWIPANHGALIDLSGVKSEDSVTITGIVTSYQDNADDPIVWQLIPRDAGDVQVSLRSDTLPVWAIWAAVGVAAALALAVLSARFVARRQLAALAETEARYRQLLALSPDAVIVHSGGAILFTNPAAARLLGVANERALVGRTITDFIDASSRAALTRVASGEETTAPPVARTRARLLSAEGHAVDVEVTTSPCLYHDRPAVVVLVRDITSQLRYERDLHALALVDDLTGLQNRRGFALFAEQELARARRNKLTPVLLFADLDDLKAINDQYGHAAGDAAIRQVATALKQTLRETDIIARWSGDEFVALMTDGGAAEAEQLETRLDGAIAEQAPDAQPFTVTASVGKTTLDPTLSLRDAMDRADAELYAKKKLSLGRRGRNTPVGIDGIAQNR